MINEKHNSLVNNTTQKLQEHHTNELWYHHAIMVEYKILKLYFILTGDNNCNKVTVSDIPNIIKIST